MSICMHVFGLIQYKEVPEKYPTDILKKYDEDVPVLERGALFQTTEGYAHWPVIEKIKSYLEENASNIEGAHFQFSNYDDDDAPYLVQLEVAEGKVYEDVLERHLSCEWQFHVQDSTWMINTSERKESVPEKPEPVKFERLREPEDLIRVNVPKDDLLNIKVAQQNWQQVVNPDIADILDDFL